MDPAALEERKRRLLEVKGLVEDETLTKEAGAIAQAAIFAEYSTAAVGVLPSFTLLIYYFFLRAAPNARSPL